jgi:hypothetical protein
VGEKSFLICTLYVYVYIVAKWPPLARQVTQLSLYFLQFNWYQSSKGFKGAPQYLARLFVYPPTLKTRAIENYSKPKTHKSNQSSIVNSKENFLAVFDSDPSKINYPQDIISLGTHSEHFVSIYLQGPKTPSSHKTI